MNKKKRDRERERSFVGYREIDQIEVTLVSNYAKSRRLEADSHHGFPNGAEEFDRKVSRREN